MKKDKKRNDKAQQGFESIFVNTTQNLIPYGHLSEAYFSNKRAKSVAVCL